MGIEGVLHRAAYVVLCHRGQAPHLFLRWFIAERGDDYHPLDSEIVLGALKSLFHRVFCVASHLLW